MHRYLDMKWVRVCNVNSLSNGDLIGFDYNNNNQENFDSQSTR